MPPKPRPSWAWALRVLFLGHRRQIQGAWERESPAPRGSSRETTAGDTAGQLSRTSRTIEIKEKQLRFVWLIDELPQNQNPEVLPCTLPREDTSSHAVA